MGIFSNQRDRLLRNEWKGPNGASQLSQELFAIFGIDTVQFDGPVKIVANPNEPFNQTPPLTITLPPGVVGSTTPPIVANSGNTNISIGGGGGSTSTTIDNLFPPAAPTDKTPAPFTMIGQIASGTGSSYTATAYPRGLNGASYTVPVTQLPIAAGETIPAGTWVLIAAFPYQSGNTYLADYYMQTPVYLSDR